MYSGSPKKQNIRKFCSFKINGNKILETKWKVLEKVCLHFDAISNITKNESLSKYEWKFFGLWTFLKDTAFAKKLFSFQKHIYFRIENDF